jgi:hypothetical protein
MMPAMNLRPLRILSIIVFFLGIISGFALSLLAIWNNFEATSYYFRGVKYDPFNGLRCPVVIAPTEKGVVAVIFDNPGQKEDNFYYRAEISGKVFSTRQIENQIAVPPNETRGIQFTVDANDIDLLFFILVKISILPNSMHRSQEAVCGIMMVDLLGLTGVQISAIGLSLSFLGISVGLFIWEHTSTNADRNVQRAMQALGFAVLFVLFTVAMGWWVAAIALSLITILLVVISLRFIIV